MADFLKQENLTIITQTVDNYLKNNNTGFNYQGDDNVSLGDVAYTNTIFGGATYSFFNDGSTQNVSVQNGFFNVGINSDSNFYILPLTSSVYSQASSIFKSFNNVSIPKTVKTLSCSLNTKPTINGVSTSSATLYSTIPTTLTIEYNIEYKRATAITSDINITVVYVLMPTMLKNTRYGNMFVYRGIYCNYGSLTATTPLTLISNLLHYLYIVPIKSAVSSYNSKYSSFVNISGTDNTTNKTVQRTTDVFTNGAKIRIFLNPYNTNISTTNKSYCGSGGVVQLPFFENNKLNPANVDLKTINFTELNAGTKINFDSNFAVSTNSSSNYYIKLNSSNIRSYDNKITLQLSSMKNLNTPSISLTNKQGSTIINAGTPIDLNNLINQNDDILLGNMKLSYGCTFYSSTNTITMTHRVPNIMATNRIGSTNFYNNVIDLSADAGGSIINTQTFSFNVSAFNESEENSQFLKDLPAVITTWSAPVMSIKTTKASQKELSLQYLESGSHLKYYKNGFIQHSTDNNGAITYYGHNNMYIMRGNNQLILLSHPISSEYYNAITNKFIKSIKLKATKLVQTGSANTTGLNSSVNISTYSIEPINNYIPNFSATNDKTIILKTSSNNMYVYLGPRKIDTDAEIVYHDCWLYLSANTQLTTNTSSYTLYYTDKIITGLDAFISGGQTKGLYYKVSDQNWVKYTNS